MADDVEVRPAMNWLRQRSLDRMAARLPILESELRELLNARLRKGQRRARGWKDRDQRIADLRHVLRTMREMLRRLD